MSTWYHSQYSTWNRTRRLSAAPYIATTENTNPSGRPATTPAVARNNAAQGAVVIDMGDLNDITNKNKNQETLFGPNIGAVTSGPAWTETAEKEKKPITDQLTPEVVKGWIAKSKETSQATTTLQALVNLKRPTLRLTPLSIAPNDDPTHKDSHDHHGLEFEYDCDAPKCGIYVHVLLAPEDQDDHSISGSALSRMLVFETVVEGGFGKVLKLEEGAILELGRFEKHRTVRAPDPSVSTAAVDTSATPAPTDEAPRKSRRFSNFHFRRRDHGREVTGPALAVVDAETTTVPAGTVKEKDTKDDAAADEGVKAIIRLIALDEVGSPLSSPNEQGTYLHVVRLGAAPPEGEEDSRPWVVKVVKREATIGPHTFHLHEIYGLSSQSSAPVAPLVPPAPATTTATATSDADADAEPHTYPPTMTTSPNLPVTPAANHEEEPSSECLLCLSSAREVVLLPCRHLVACKECAMNMVEFGAGGTIVQPEAEVPAAGGSEGAAAGGTEGADNTEATGAGTVGAVIPTAANTGLNSRRKRKAKGWFCPVCRQPYTSLLRITTSPPTSKEGKEIDNRDSTSSEGIEHAGVPAVSPTNTSRGPLASLRPSFLRGMSRPPAATASSEQTGPAPTLPQDVERSA